MDKKYSFLVYKGVLKIILLRGVVILLGDREEYRGDRF